MESERLLSTREVGSYTVKQAAPLVGVSPRSLRLMAQLGQIGHSRVGPHGGKIVFDLADIEAYLEKARRGEVVEPVKRRRVPQAMVSKHVDLSEW